jgi:acyl-CoA thioesterase FadM
MPLAFGTLDWSSTRVGVYEKSFTVSHADVDFLGEFEISRLLGALEAAAVEASARAGYGPAEYHRIGRVWIIRRTRLERLAPIGGGDRLVISTHVEDIRRARSLRRYEIGRVGGFGPVAPGPVARATTDWVHCDALSGKPVVISDELAAALCSGTPGPALPRAHPVPLPTAPATTETMVRIRPSDLDHMDHVNNARWADLLLDAAQEALPEAGVEAGASGTLRPRSFDLEYLMPAGMEQNVSIFSWVDPSETETVVTQIARDAGTQLLVRAQSRWLRIHPPEFRGAPPSW